MLKKKSSQSKISSTQSHQQCRLQRNGNNSYSCPPLHLEAPVWQHALCTKAKKQAQVCHVWQRKYHEHAVATRRISKNLQQGRAGGEGTGYRGDNTCQKKSRDTVQPRFRPFFVNRPWGRWPNGVAFNEALKIVHILEFKQSTDRDEEFLEVHDAEANEQHKSIICAIQAAAPEW